MTTPPETEPGALRVAHVLRKYLPYSQAWLHRLISGPQDVAASVVAERLVRPGPAAFPLSNLLVLSTSFPAAYWLAVLSSHGGRRGPSLALDSLRAQAPRLVHAHFGHTAWRWLPVARRLRVPLVASFYGWEMSALPSQQPWWRLRYRQLFAAGALFLCEGPAMARALVALGCPAERIGLQRLGIDTRAVSASPRRVRRGEPLQVLAAARFTEKKGLPDAIAAVARASREIDVRLTVAGGPVRTLRGWREARRIAAAAAASGLGERLRFVGVLPHAELLALAQRSHVLLQPSRRAANGDSEGGLPVTLVDAAATGLPAVATRHADIPELVRDGESGLLAGEGDVAALAAQLVRVSREPGLLEHLSEQAVDRVRAEFSAERCTASLRAHYERVLSWR